jgi:hypothetical protein
MMTVGTLQSADDKRHFANTVSYINYKRGLTQSQINVAHYFHNEGE